MIGGFAPSRGQLRVLKVIAKNIAKRGVSPTMREIGAELGIRSVNGVNDHLICLERKGLILRRGERGMSRRIAFTDHGRSFVEEVFPRHVDIPAVPHVTIGQSFCGVCGATTFAPTMPCVICKVIREETAA